MADYDKVKALLKGGISRPTLYRVQFYPPRSSAVIRLGDILLLNDYSKYLVKETVLPGSTLVTTPVKGHSRIGVFYDQPVGATYDDTLTAVFVERNDMFVQRFFMNWMNIIMPGFKQSPTGSTNIHVGYYDEFSTKLEIFKMDIITPTRIDPIRIRNNEYLVDKMKYTFHGVYPVDIATIPLASDATDSYISTAIQFKYESFHITYNTDQLGNRVLESITNDPATQQLINTFANSLLAGAFDVGTRDFLTSQSNNLNTQSPITDSSTFSGFPSLNGFG